MVKVENNKITMTRGDTRILKLNLLSNLSRVGGPPYSRYYPKDHPGDSLKFTMSRGFAGDKNYLLVKGKDPVTGEWVSELNIVPENMVLNIPYWFTRYVPYGVYNYSIQLTHENSEDEKRVDTVVSGIIQLLGETDPREGETHDSHHDIIEDSEYANFG